MLGCQFWGDAPAGMRAALSEAGFVTGAVYVSDGGMTRKMIYR